MQLPVMEAGMGRVVIHTIIIILYFQWCRDKTHIIQGFLPPNIMLRRVNLPVIGWTIVYGFKVLDQDNLIWPGTFATVIAKDIQRLRACLCQEVVGNFFSGDRVLTFQTST